MVSEAYGVAMALRGGPYSAPERLRFAHDKVATTESGHFEYSECTVVAILMFDTFMISPTSGILFMISLARATPRARPSP